MVKLAVQQSNIAIIPNNITAEFILSIGGTNCVRTSTTKKPCPALSKILESRSYCEAVNGINSTIIVS